MLEKIKETLLFFMKHTEDGKFLDKEKAITEWLDKHNLSYEYENGIGLIINKQKDPKNIIVSHIDLIPSFRKAFKKNDERKFRETKNHIYGALDNTLTNALALLALKENKNSQKEKK